MIRKFVVSALALVLLAALADVTPAAAEEKKMTREEYVAKMAEYSQAEEQATGAITELDSQIASLQSKLGELNSDIASIESAILRLVDSTDSAVRSHGGKLDGIIGQLSGLMALAPEELYMHHRMELDDIDAQLDELKASKLAALPEIAAKIGRVEDMLGQLRNRGMRELTQLDYTVERGDHLWAISKKETIYADPYMWPRIYRANRDKIADPDLIYPDQVLAIPVAVGENQYLVTSGDFLYNIAASVYNDPTKWHRILKANESQIVEKDLIFPAQVLEVPVN